MYRKQNVLRGPLIGCKVLRSVTEVLWPKLESIELMDSQQLGGDSMSHLGDSWRHVTGLNILDSFLDASVLLQICTGWPQLRHLSLSNNQLDANAVWALTQVRWTDLYTLSLNISKLEVSVVCTGCS